MRLRILGLSVVPVLLVMLTSGWPVPAQDEDNVSARSYQIRYRPLSDAVDLVSEVLSADGSVSLQPRLKRLVVQDRTSVLDRVGALLESFDLPPRNVEVTVSLFMGSDRRREEAGRHAPPSSISREFRGVSETLGDFTKWTAYDPLGSRSITCTEGGTVTADLSDQYRILFEIESVQEKQGKVKFSSFTLQKVSVDADGREQVKNLYTTGIVLPTGRLLVVGAASAPESRRALFLTLQADTD